MKDKSSEWFSNDHFNWFKTMLFRSHSTSCLCLYWLLTCINPDILWSTMDTLIFILLEIFINIPGKKMLLFKNDFKPSFLQNLYRPSRSTRWSTTSNKFTQWDNRMGKKLDCSKEWKTRRYVKISCEYLLWLSRILSHYLFFRVISRPPSKWEKFYPKNSKNSYYYRDYAKPNYIWVQRLFCINQYKY